MSREGVKSVFHRIRKLAISQPLAVSFSSQDFALFLNYSTFTTKMKLGINLEKQMYLCRGLYR